jgi:hypothetical protein
MSNLLRLRRGTTGKHVRFMWNVGKERDGRDKMALFGAPMPPNA